MCVNKSVWGTGALLLALLGFGCASPRAWNCPETPEAPVIDGKLTEAAWQNADWRSLERPEGCGILEEGGRAALLYDHEFLYVGVELTDGDVLMHGQGDQTLLYENGDTVEVFLKSRRSSAYVELYGTPTGEKTSIRFQCRSYRHLAGAAAQAPVLKNLRVGSTVQGTLNDNADVDRGWTTEIAIPLREVEALTGRAFDPASGEWTIQVARYNYGIGLNDMELSAVPKLSAENFHMYEEYLPLQ